MQMLSLLLTALSLQGGDIAGTGILNLRVSGFHGLRGSLRIAIFHRGEFFPEDIDNAFMRVVEPVTADPMPVSIEGLPHGLYAIALFHDRNDDAVLDRNILGIPTERFGFSGGARAVTGPPSYESAAFLFDNPSLLLFIEMQ